MPFIKIALICILSAGGLYFLGPNLYGNYLVSNETACVNNFDYPRKTITACTVLIAQSPHAEDELHRLTTARSYAYFGLDNYEKGLEDIEEAIALKPDNLEHWRLKATYSYVSGDHEQGFEDYEKVFELDPDALHDKLLRAGFSLKYGYYDLALKDFETLWARAPHIKEFAFFITRIHLVRKDYDAALLVLNKAIAMWPDDEEFRFVLGVLHYDYTHDFNAALKIFTTKRKVDPDDPLNLVYLAAVQFQLGNELEGKALIHQLAHEFYVRDNPSPFNYWIGSVGEESYKRMIRKKYYAMAKRPDLAMIELDAILESGEASARRYLIFFADLFGLAFGTDEEIKNAWKIKLKDFPRALSKENLHQLSKDILLKAFPQ